MKYTRIELLNKQIQQNERQLESFTGGGSLYKMPEKEIKKTTAYLQKSKQKLEMEALSESACGDTPKRPGKHTWRGSQDSYDAVFDNGRFYQV